MAMIAYGTRIISLYFICRITPNLIVEMSINNISVFDILQSDATECENKNDI